ncbi:hypothetical protein V5O48_003016 [Marasmius crinis-equi]|uniref:F-box domain-containing protein n=1 Tax=Marasmius crinis-equi TaxID=585013 RepID=A0ABR3FU03_9AGAR
MVLVFEACRAGNDITVRGVCIPRPTPPLIVLCAVCGRWRKLALETPSLWATVKINVIGNPRTPTNVYCTTQLFFERSHQTLVHADVGYTPVDDDRSDFFQIVAENSRRWRTMSLRLTCKGSHQPVFNTIRDRLPMLDNLSITLAGTGAGDVGKSFLTAFETCPSLHTVVLDMKLVCAGLLLPWNQIRILRLRQCHVHDAMIVFTRVPTAEQITIDGLFQDVELHDDNNITLASVKTLAFDLGTEPDSTADGALSDILRQCKIPRLESITISQSYPPTDRAWDVPWTVTFFRDLILGSACRLTSISLCHVPIADYDLISILELTPRLTKLEIREGFPDTYYIETRMRKNTTVTSHLLRRLTVQYHPREGNANIATNNPYNILIPRLRELSLSVFDGDLASKALVEMIVSRCPVADGRPSVAIGVNFAARYFDPLSHVNVTVHVREETNDFAELLGLCCFREAGLMMEIRVDQELEYDV